MLNRIDRTNGFEKEKKKALVSFVTSETLTFIHHKKLVRYLSLELILLKLVFLFHPMADGPTIQIGSKSNTPE